jgi:hypothetical protein
VGSFAFHVLPFEPLANLRLPGKAGRAAPDVSRAKRSPESARVFARIALTVARTPEVMVKITSCAYTTSKANAHAAYVTRRGRLPAEDEEGFDLDWRSVRTKLSGW